MTQGSGRQQPATSRGRRGLRRRRLVGLLAGLMFSVTTGPAGAVVATPPATRGDASVPRGAVELAANRGKDFTAPAKPPERGSSAELHGGSSADRYGGSSADRSGVAGRRDTRNRSVHQYRRRDSDNRRKQNQNQGEQQEQDEEEGEQR